MSSAMSQAHNMEFYSELLERHQYALVDRVAISAEILKRFPLVPLDHWELRNEDDSDQMPALLPLEPGAPHMELLAACMTLGEEEPGANPVATFIVVSPDIKPGRLQTHLSSRLIVQSPQGRAFLRYYSSDVFPHLVRILAPARLKSLFGPEKQVYQWTYRFQNEWITVPVPDVTKGVPLSWIIRREEHESLDLVGEVNKTLDAYQKKMGRPWKDHAEWNEKACAAEHFIRIAQRTHRLDAPADLIAFAMQALAHGERIHSHPRIHNLLKDTASRPSAYHDAVRHIADDEWVAMAAELSLQKIN